MTRNLFEARYLQLKIHASSWQDALAKAADPLIQDGGIDTAYIDDMVEAIKKLGPYIVLAPGLALGHARPSAAVHRPCVAIATLDEPVAFGSEHNDPVDIVVIFAAVDDDAHIELLRRLVIFFNAPDSLNSLRAACTTKDALDIVCAINTGE
ncbi:putative PTS IIA-like nitrogen-regulatory protein PtsN [Coriobacterium glomerans PW2]|uniref:Ascorbate-specific PTS system EIIA component n=2 Tax=Coriobacterium TaxID=33870 RepID=F2NAT9_CORGP|nr:putative PTS IIA-like nitrogen-regulatory protein PtsN [Coriobacterium glomerans PW2]